MLATIICERYGWTWQEFHDQPGFFIDCILDKMRAEASVSRRGDRADRMMSRVRGKGVD